MATKQQTPKVAAIIVEFQEVFNGLSTADKQWIIQHGKEANELFVDLIKNGNKENVLSEVLSQGAFEFHGGVFSVEDNFSTRNTNIKFAYINSNFIDRFANIVEINDPGVSAQIYSRRVRREQNKKDSVIFELGGIEKAKVSFKEIYWLLLDVELDILPGSKKLISKTTPNKFITCSKEGAICLVDFTWQQNGWRVNSYPGGMIDFFFQPGSITFSHES